MLGSVSRRGRVFSTIVAVWFLRFTDGASVLETASLIEAASVLGIAPGTWNFSTDPCVGGWLGVGCCRNNSQASCCAFPQIYPPTPPLTPCERTADAQVSTLILRFDLFNNQLLNGTLPEALCNLTSLRILDLGLHHLRGQVPGCIGSSLSGLQILRIGDNRFSGSIPEELGELSNLQQLFLDSANISGSIPASLGRLSSLTNLNLRSNALEGDLPVEIGQLSNLVELSLQVNRLTGRIPDSYGNLTSLQEFRLFNNELSGGVNSSVLQRMTSLTDVSLRHNRFNGPVPDFGLGLRLVTLDLGFNDFSGPLPASLGSLSSLTSLFVDHNRLNGSIPDSFGSFSALAQLDISHNMLAGSLQALQGNSQLDVSFNFFNIASAPASLPPQPSLGSSAYFNCIPSGSSGICSRSSPGGRLFFAVNAGGNGLSSTTGRDVQVAFDSDAGANPSNEGVGFFYGPGPGLWALEFSGSQGGTFPFQGFIDMSRAGNTEGELYRSMRWSSSYIAYHGYSLRPGNYTVTLYFAELVFTEPGYRIFDVVIQGRVVMESLDIAREAGARAAYVLSRNITIDNNGSVSVELVYRGRDRYLDAGPWAVRNSGPIISAVSVVSVDYRGEDQGSSSLSSGQIAGIVLGSGAALLVLVALLVYIFCRGKGKRAGGGASTTSRRTSVATNQQASLLDAGGIFTYQELHDATQGFSDKLGEGGFGAVYKGTLPSGTVIAVKQLVKHTQQIEEDFKREISIISKVRHRNLLAVIGYSLESDVPMLVCEFIPNGSLDKWLFRRRESALSWGARREIAIGVARGLAYLHDESKLRIIHCDVKPANILLDEDLNPRLADFGLARLYDEKASHVTATRLKGTAGYLAPEYAMHLQLSDKVDVYSFGVVLLELLSGRRAVELSAPSEQIVLVDWAHKEAEIPANLMDIMDKKLQGEFEELEARDMASIAILCTQRSAALRPKMQAVWLMLTGAVKVPEFLENLSAVIPSSSGGSTSQSLSSGNLAETSMSAAFRSLRVFAGSPENSSSSKALTS